MTLDEAIKNYEKIAEENQRVVDTGSVINDVAIYYQRRAGEYRQLAGWLKELRQLKEQQPCDDAISRKAVYEQINSWNSNGEYSYTNATYYLMKRIRNIPPVTPQLKRGKWLNGELIPNDITGHWYAECSECGKVRIVDNYCPNCGARKEIEE